MDVDEFVNEDEEGRVDVQNDDDDMGSDGSGHDDEVVLPLGVVEAAAVGCTECL
jgi:hypothetical protein